MLNFGAGFRLDLLEVRFAALLDIRVVLRGVAADDEHQQSSSNAHRVAPSARTPR